MTKLDNLHNVAISAKNLRVFRERYAKMSRPKFAEILGIPPTTLKNYELGYREVGVCIYNGIYNRFGKDALLFVMANVPLAEPEEGSSVTPFTGRSDKIMINGGFVNKVDALRYGLSIGDAVAFGQYAKNQFLRAQ